MAHREKQHQRFYRLPEAYEIAFSYREISRECDFLADLYRLQVGREPGAVLELACGPGAHVREFYRRGQRVAAVDLSPAMIAYLREQIGDSPRAELLVADMAAFQLSRPVDLAFTLLDSLPYLITNQQLVRHFRSVRAALSPQGLYVVELRHPREIWFSGTRHAPERWTMERGSMRVTTEWGAAIEYDPLRQVERVMTRMTVERGGEQEVVESWGELRPLLPQELLALVELAGGWRFVDWWGGFDPDRPLGAQGREWRLIGAFQAA